LGKIAHDLLTFGGLQVDRHRTFVAVDTVVISRLGLSDADTPIPGIVAAYGVFNFDDFCAKVAQHHAAPGARKDT